MTDIFDQKASIDDALVQEYHDRSKRKLEDDKWLKANKPAILEAMAELGRDKKDFSGYRVSVNTPDESRFDSEKVIEWLVENVAGRTIDRCLRTVLNEEELVKCIEEGLIDLEVLKAVAWVEKTGTPRLTVKPV